MFTKGPSFYLLKVNPDIRDASHGPKAKAILLRWGQLAVFIQLENLSLGRSDTAVRPSAGSMLRQWEVHIISHVW
jgi:hypothetical protein